jgi:hypothetical protein
LTPFCTYSSVRKLVKLTAVQFMLNNHTVSANVTNWTRIHTIQMNIYTFMYYLLQAYRHPSMSPVCGVGYLELNFKMFMIIYDIRFSNLCLCRVSTSPSWEWTTSRI